MRNLLGNSKKLQLWISVLAVVSISAGVLENYLSVRSESMRAKKEIARLNLLRKTIGKTLVSDNKLPDAINIGSEEYKVTYTVNDSLDSYVRRILRRYRSDYSAVVVIDNNTGKIISAVGHQRRGNRFNMAIPFSNTHPSASLIKIITSADLLNKQAVNNDTVFNYRGRGTTLYRYQLKNRVTRWSRYISLEKAFAISNNVVFGKAAINHLTGGSLFMTAQKMGFNRPIMSGLVTGQSHFPVASGEYNLAELASGFNSRTKMSPIHAAMLSSIIANDGVMKHPKIIDHVVDGKTHEELIADVNNGEERVLDSKVANGLREMMELTIKRGTARSSFRKMRRSIRSKLEIGGKTGTITGGIPHGRRDWFTAYALPKGDPTDKGISISVMNVNVNKWYIKSSLLAQKIIEHYYHKVTPINKKLSKQEKKKPNRDV